MNEIDWENIYLNLDRLSDESITRFLNALFQILHERVYKNGT